MRILITEEALQTGVGHWPGYIGGIAGAVRSAGDVVDVLVHREATATVVDAVGGTPWFTRNCWLDSRSQGAVGGIRHNLKFRSEVVGWIKNHDPYDWVCGPTIRLQHLLAFALLTLDPRLSRRTKFLLLFVQGFGRYAGHGNPSIFPNSPSTWLARLCFRVLAPAIRAGRVILAAETAGMQGELARFTGLEVTLFPHPVPAMENGAAHVAPADGSITITCPGFARHEKGSDLLQAAIKRLLAIPAANHLRFVMQWPEPFPMPDGSWLGIDPELVDHPGIEWLNQSLDATAYEQLLARSDLVIVPYRRESYHHRVSRVAIEAASRSIPLIYMRGTWSESIAQIAGAGVAIEDETVEAVTDAIVESSRDLAALRVAAVAGAVAVATYHSTATFRELIASA
jgi:hypothetical protein